MAAPALDALAKSSEPSLRYELRAHVLGENPESRAMRALRREIERSPRVQALLAGREPDGRLLRQNGVYHKWQGAVLAAAQA